MTKSPDPAAQRAFRNLKMASDLFEFCYMLKRHQLRLKHPEYDEPAIHREVMRLIEAASQ